MNLKTSNKRFKLRKMRYRKLIRVSILFDTSSRYQYFSYFVLIPSLGIDIFRYLIAIPILGIYTSFDTEISIPAIPDTTSLR